MNDYEFGKKLYELRKQHGYSQDDIANFAKVTDKAVSKWKNGKSKPSIEVLKKLANL